MAGMQEQLRQLEDVNEDMIDESQRYELIVVCV